MAGEGAGADAVLRADPVLAAGAGRAGAGHVRGGRPAPAVRRLRRGGGVVRAGERRGAAARMRAPVPRPRRPRRGPKRPGRRAHGVEHRRRRDAEPRPGAGRVPHPRAEGHRAGETGPAGRPHHRVVLRPTPPGRRPRTAAGSEADGKPYAGCGSGAGAAPAPGEIDGTGAGAAQGASDVERELVRINTAAAIRQHAEQRGRGSVPGGLLQEAEQVLVPAEGAVAAGAGPGDPPRRGRPAPGTSTSTRRGGTAAGTASTSPRAAASSTRAPTARRPRWC